MAGDETMESETLQKNVKPEETLDMESQIKAAMRARVSHFRQQADSLTFEGVRRLLEKDLGLETCALDVHKRLVKQLLLESLEGANGDNDLEKSSASGENNVVAESSEGFQAKKEVKESFSEDEKMEDSPVLGLLTGHKTIKSEAEGFKETSNKKTPNESLIKAALTKRAPYLKANSENVTMAGLRRLLEEDLKLDKYALDPFKKFISQHLDEALQSQEASELAIGAKKTSEKKVSKKVSSKESSDSSIKESDEEEDDVRPRKKSVPKRKLEKSDVIKNRKRPAKDAKVSSKKRAKPAETTKDNTSAGDSGNLSENGDSQSSEEKPIKKKEASTPVYGKRVEHLKSIIKACGMSVPPVIYKKVKQVPESKREAQLIKELEEILSREGLSSNPSEKEIKEIRKKKERAKELEGIDMSNIVTSSRRRSTTSYVAPPKPKLPIESDSDDEENSDDEDDEEEEEEDNDGGEENAVGDNGKNNSSQSEEYNEGADDEEDND